MPVSRAELIGLRPLTNGVDAVMMCSALAGPELASECPENERLN